MSNEIATGSVPENKYGIFACHPKVDVSEEAWQALFDGPIAALQPAAEEYHKRMHEYLMKNDSEYREAVAENEAEKQETEEKVETVAEAEKKTAESEKKEAEADKADEKEADSGDSEEKEVEKTPEEEKEQESAPEEKEKAE